MQPASSSSSASRRSSAGGLGGARLDNQRAGGVRLGCDEAQELLQAHPQPVSPVLATLAGGGLDTFAEPLTRPRRGGEEAVFLVFEVLVEGGSRDARPVEDVLDATSRWPSSATARSIPASSRSR